MFALGQIPDVFHLCMFVVGELLGVAHLQLGELGELHERCMFALNKLRELDEPRVFTQGELHTCESWARFAKNKRHTRGAASVPMPMHIDNMTMLTYPYPLFCVGKRLCNISGRRNTGRRRPLASD